LNLQKKKLLVCRTAKGAGRNSFRRAAVPALWGAAGGILSTAKSKIALLVGKTSPGTSPRVDIPPAYRMTIAGDHHLGVKRGQSSLIKKEKKKRKHEGKKQRRTLGRGAELGKHMNKL